MTEFSIRGGRIAYCFSVDTTLLLQSIVHSYRNTLQTLAHSLGFEFSDTSFAHSEGLSSDLRNFSNLGLTRGTGWAIGLEGDSDGASNDGFGAGLNVCF